MADDALLHKAASIERCLKRIQEEYAGAPLETSQTRQDALVLNLLRACETAIDMAMHTCRKKRLGAPQSSRQAFELLQQAGIIPESTETQMKRMVGFRNIAVHEYREMELDIVKTIVEKHLSEFTQFTKALLNAD